jgi:NitT/TauT family transport system ATP-binding protein
VAENIALALPPGGNRAVIAPLLDSLGLGGWSDAFPNRLSLGMARRVAVARALAAAPELLLLDEPLASLDAAAAMGVRDVLRAHRLTTLLVSHDAADVAALADRVIVLGGNPTVIRGVVAVNALTGPALAQRIAAVHEALP